MSEIRFPLLVLALFILPVFIPPLHTALATQWMYAGLGGGLVILLYSFAYPAHSIAERVTKFHWLLLAFYTFHQFEEHGIDLFGASYSFVAYANQLLTAPGEPARFTTTNILFINTLVVWLGGLAAVWGGWRYVWPGLAMAGIIAANALMHIGIAIAQGEYNPGLATALTVFLPAFFFYGRLLVQEGGLGAVVLLYAFLWGVIGHLVLPVMVPFSRDGGAMAYLLFCVLALVPLAANMIFSRMRAA